jgi:coenzyme F420-reducing hydrogenase gamma subunit
MVAHGTPCLGPITQAGCGAICPAYHRGCYACFGPKETPNPASLMRRWQEHLGVSERDVIRALRTFNAYAPGFREESEAYERTEA